MADASSPATPAGLPQEDGADELESYALVIRLARRMLPATLGSSITVGPPGGEGTAASAGLLAAQLDATQYHLDEGPCLAAARTGEPVVIDRMRDEQRWPRFAATAADGGVASSTSLPFTTADGASGALNLYSATECAFDSDEARAAGQAVLRYLTPAPRTSAAIRQLTRRLDTSEPWLVDLAHSAGLARDALEQLRPEDLQAVPREARDRLGRATAALQSATDHAPPELWDALHDPAAGGVAAWADDAAAVRQVPGTGDLAPLPRYGSAEDRP